MLAIVRFGCLRRRYAVLISATLVVVWSVRGHSPSDGKHPFASILLKADPAISTSGPLPAKSLGSGRAEDHGKTLLVCAQYCACNAQLVAKLTQATGDHAKVVSSVAGSQSTPDLGATSAVVVADPDFSLRSQLDVCFVPRAYLFSEDGKLIWLQKGPAVHLAEEVQIALSSSQIGGQRWQTSMNEMQISIRIECSVVVRCTANPVGALAGGLALRG